MRKNQLVVGRNYHLQNHGGPRDAAYRYIGERPPGLVNVTATDGTPARYLAPGALEFVGEGGRLVWVPDGNYVVEAAETRAAREAHEADEKRRRDLNEVVMRKAFEALGVEANTTYASGRVRIVVREVLADCTVDNLPWPVLERLLQAAEVA